MILGTESRVRTTVALLDRDSEFDVVDPPDPGDHRDRGHFLTPRLYPTAPFDAWQPASVYAERYTVAKESM